MKIILNNEWCIEGIPLNYVLQRTYLTRGNAKNVSAKPRMVTRDVGYYQTIEAAVTRFCKETVDENTKDFVGDLKEYAKRVSDIMKYTSEEIAKGVTIIADGNN